MPLKFSPPLKDGRKHFTVTMVRWGRETESVVLATNAAEARRLPRHSAAEYVSRVRRSSPDEVAALAPPADKHENATKAEL